MKARGLGTGQERFKDCFRNAAGVKFLEAMRAGDITNKILQSLFRLLVTYSSTM